MNLLRLFGCYLNEYLSLVDSPLALSIRSRSIRFPSPRHLNFTFRISHHIAIVIISHRARKEGTLAQPVKLFNTFAGFFPLASCSVIVRSEREKRIELRIFFPSSSHLLQRRALLGYSRDEPRSFMTEWIRS